MSRGSSRSEVFGAEGCASFGHLLRYRHRPPPIQVRPAGGGRPACPVQSFTFPLLGSVSPPLLGPDPDGNAAERVEQFGDVLQQRHRFLGAILAVPAGGVADPPLVL